MAIEITQPDMRRHDDRRLQPTRWHFPERRSGFDRRRQPGWRGRYLTDLRGYANSKLAFPLVLATIIVFNLVDYLMTLRVLGEGGLELNPVMQHLFSTSMEVAALVKLLSAGAVTLVLLSLRRYRRTLEVSLVVLLGYSVLMFYHVYLALQMTR